MELAMERDSQGNPVMPVDLYISDVNLNSYRKAFTCTWEIRRDTIGTTLDDSINAIEFARKLNCPSFCGLYFAVPVRWQEGGHHATA